MPEFYMKFARKKYFPDFFFLGGGVEGKGQMLPYPPFPTPMSITQ